MNTDMMGGFVLGGIAVAFLVINIVYYVFQIIAGWKIFTKAGEKGWKSLIPVYNLYTQYKLTWKPVMVIPVVLLSVFCGITQNYPDSTTLYTIGSIAGLAGTVLTIIGLDKLSKSFGKGKGFTVGLFFLAPIFYLILGFGSAKYIGNTTQQGSSAK